MSKIAGLIWTDAMGEKTLNVVRTSTGVGAIEDALQEYSNAGLTECWEGLDELILTSPSTDAYPTLRVVAKCTFQSATGSTASVYIPAPQTSIFLSDGDTVDPSAIPDLITACVGNLLCGDGTTATMFVGGTIVRTRFSGLVSTTT